MKFLLISICCLALTSHAFCEDQEPVKMSASFFTKKKQNKYWLCNKCGRYHKTEPKTCEGCGHDSFFTIWK